MERIVERPGALDVHKATVTACVRVWQGRELEEQMAEFATTVQGLLALRDWLEALGVKQVAMEATGVYWKPVWAMLEDRFELMLVNARHVKAGPRSQDRRQGRAVALSAVGGRAVEGELRAAQADPHAAELDPVSQDADLRPPAGGRPAAQDPRGHRDQARLRRV